ncbi:MAG: hypothetical protein E7361_04535 [Clostridiales bacterium]|nr:hypothetical protein [Clostridiales bacterium]
MAYKDYVRYRKVENIKAGVLRKFPLLGATMSNLEFVYDENTRTLSTDGEKVYYSEEFMDQFSYDDKVFFFSHEVMHVAFDHLLRSKGKDKRLWNNATDAVINQLLKGEGYDIPAGLVNKPEAEGKSAEEMYEILLKEAQEQNQQDPNSNGKSGNNQLPNNTPNQPNSSPNEQQEEDNNQDQEENNTDNQQQNQQTNSQDQQQDNDQQDSESNGSGENTDNEQDEDYQNTQNSDNMASHDRWEDAIKRAEQNMNDNNDGGSDNKDMENNNADENKDREDTKDSNSNSQDGVNQSKDGDQQSNTSDMEKNFSQQNSDLKNEMGQRIREKIRNRSDKVSSSGSGKGGYTSSFSGVGEAKEVISWKKILKRELEKEEERWSYRRADADNDYMARVESVETYDHPSTEVMLDVSGSVDDDFLRGFLRQLKPLLKESDLKVGCFDEYFYGLKEIKSNKDIDNFTVTRTSAWTENWDLAVRSFTKSKDINKIIFTDGEPCPGVMPKDDLKNEKVIWLVFGNENFNPCCGKVINIDRRELDRAIEERTI